MTVSHDDIFICSMNNYNAVVSIYKAITNPTSQRLDIQIGGRGGGETGRMLVFACMPHSLKFSGYNLLLKTREPNKSGKFCFFRRVSSISPGQFAIQNARTQYVWDYRPFQTMPKEMAILMKFCPNALKCSKNKSVTIGHSKRCPRKRPYL